MSGACVLGDMGNVRFIGRRATKCERPGPINGKAPGAGRRGPINGPLSCLWGGAVQREAVRRRGFQRFEVLLATVVKRLISRTSATGVTLRLEK